MSGMMPLGILAVLCAALAVTPALAQDAAPATGIDAHAKDGLGDTAAAKTPSTPPAPDAGRRGAAQAEQGKQAAAATSVNSDLGPVQGPVSPDGAAAGLRRRANVKMLIAGPTRGAAALPTRSRPDDLQRLRPVSPSLRPGPETVRNAIGAATPGAHLTALGVHPQISGLPGSPNAGVVGGGAANPHRTAPIPDAAARPHATGINGTAMGRVAVGPAPIGGHAKDRSAINGTIIRPKP